MQISQKSKPIKKPKATTNFNFRGRPSKPLNSIPFTISLLEIKSIPHRVMELPEFYLLFKLPLDYEYRNRKIYLDKNQNKREFLRKYREKKAKSPFAQFLNVVLDVTEKSLPWIAEFKDLLEFAVDCFALESGNFFQMMWEDDRCQEILMGMNERDILLKEIHEILTKWKICFNDYVIV